MMEHEHVLLFIIIIVAVMVLGCGRGNEFIIVLMLAFAYAVNNAQKKPEVQHVEHECKCTNMIDNADVNFTEPHPIDVYDEEEDLPDLKAIAYDNSQHAWGSNPKYTNCYEPPYSESNQCNTGAYLGFDEANARLSAMRQRDKRTLDGWATKNANFYRKNFSNELELAENKRWWGNSDY